MDRRSPASPTRGSTALTKLGIAAAALVVIVVVMILLGPDAMAQDAGGSDFPDERPLRYVWLVFVGVIFLVVLAMIQIFEVNARKKPRPKVQPTADDE